MLILSRLIQGFKATVSTTKNLELSTNNITTTGGLEF